MEEDYLFLSPFKKCIPTKLTCQKVSVFEVDYTFFNQRNKIYVEENYQFLPLFKKQIIQVKTSIPQIHCLKWKYFFQPKKRNICGSGWRLSIFVTFQKMYPDKIYIPKSFSVWSWLHFLQSKEQKLCEKRLSIFATFQKTNYPGKNFHAKKFSFWNWIYFFFTFFNQRNEIYVEENYQFLKNVSQKKFHAKNFQLFKLITVFFNQRNEMNAKENYQFL